jgi:hypothetical protein
MFESKTLFQKKSTRTHRCGTSARTYHGKKKDQSTPGKCITCNQCITRLNRTQLWPNTRWTKWVTCNQFSNHHVNRHESNYLSDLHSKLFFVGSKQFGCDLIRIKSCKFYVPHDVLLKCPSQFHIKRSPRRGYMRVFNLG